VVLENDLDRIAFEAALEVDERCVVLCRLRDLRADEGVGLGQVVAQGEANRVSRQRGLTPAAALLRPASS